MRLLSQKWGPTQSLITANRASPAGTCREEGSPVDPQPLDGVTAGGRRKTTRLLHRLFINTDPVRGFWGVNRKKEPNRKM